MTGKLSTFLNAVNSGAEIIYSELPTGYGHKLIQCIKMNVESEKLKMGEFKLLCKLLETVNVDDELSKQIDKISNEVAEINRKICELNFVDERLMNAYLKIHKCMTRYGYDMSLEGDEISIIRKNPYWAEIRIMYVRSADGEKCFQQTYSDLKDRDGYYEEITDELIDVDEIMSYWTIL